MSESESLEHVRRLARERLYPRLTSPNWLILRARRKLFAKWFETIPGAGLQVLDVGGRLQPYRPLLRDRCAGYLAVDLRRTPLVNVVGRAEELPFGDARFDIVICTQVLEYVPDPRRAVREMYRVLKPGGFAVLSVPSVFPRDSEVEYWRFLRSAVDEMLSDFAKVEVAAEGNSLVGLVRTLAVCAVSFTRPAFLAKLLSYTLIPLLNGVGVLAEQLSEDDRFAANFSALARK